MDVFHWVRKITYIPKANANKTSAMPEHPHLEAVLMGIDLQTKKKSDPKTCDEMLGRTGMSWTNMFRTLPDTRCTKEMSGT